MYAIRPTTDSDWRVSRAERSETAATISPLAALGAAVVLMSLWFGVVTLLDRTSHQPNAASTSHTVMARS
jgi:hypothetical protein